MRIVNNKTGNVKTQRAEPQKIVRAQALSSVQNASDAFAPHAHLALTNFFNESLFMKLELLLALFQKANGKSSNQPELPSLERVRQLFKGLRTARQYSPETLKNVVKVFSQAARLRSVPAQLFTDSGASSSVAKEIQVIREFFEHFQLYEALNRDYEGKTFLSFPLVNLFAPDRDIQVFLYVEKDTESKEERMRFFSFRLDIPTEHLGIVSLWGALRAEHVDIEAEVESEHVRDILAQTQDRLEKGLSGHQYHLEKLLVKIRARAQDGGQEGVEFTA